MPLFERMEIEKRIAAIRTLQAQVEMSYSNILHQQLSPAVEEAYLVIARDAYYKLQREIHNLWLEFCSQGADLDKHLRIPPGQ